MKKLLNSIYALIFTLAFALAFVNFSSPAAQASGLSPVDIHFFWGDGCPHCEEEREFLEDLEVEYPLIELHDYEVWNSDENRALLAEAGENLGIEISGVPFTIIGNQYISGYQDDATTGAAIEEIVLQCLETEGGCPDVMSGESGSDSIMIGLDTISLPIFGEIEVEEFSLPALTIMIGVLDGFNPCAMWALLFLISLLLGMEDRRRMWILGSAFIVASAFVYFMFMSAWLNLMLFLGFIVWVRLLIGLIALGGGGYNLKEYFTNKDATCKVTSGTKRQKTFAKIKALAHEKNFWVALGGIILLAFAVNLVELICSAGLPAVYTQILTLNDLPTWKYYGYLLLYILFFMIDDLFVFTISMVTLQITGVTTKYTRMSHLIGGVLMTLIGLLLIFKPEWLMFG
jgi:glutaredoxin